MPVTITNSLLSTRKIFNFIGIFSQSIWKLKHILWQLKQKIISKLVDHPYVVVKRKTVSLPLCMKLDSFNKNAIIMLIIFFTLKRQHVAFHLFKIKKFLLGLFLNIINTIEIFHGNHIYESKKIMKSKTTTITQFPCISSNLHARLIAFFECSIDDFEA